MGRVLLRSVRATAVLVVTALLAVLPGGATAFASLTSAGTEFWLAFPTNYSQTPTLSLFLAGETPASGSVTVPGTGYTTSFTTTPGQVTTVSLPSATQVSTPDGVEARGIHVQATAPVSVYGLNRIRYTTDAYLGLPTQILGSEYVVMSHPGLQSFGSELSVVSPSDGTMVTIVPSVSTGTRRAGTPYTVTLQRGEVYQLRASGTEDLTGTIITASRPVAAFSGTSCANVPVGYYYCDHLVEQLTPPNTWGSNFATMPLATRTGGDTFRFLAASDGTAVLVDGVQVAQLDKGEVHQQLLTTPSSVTSSRPILVAQFSNGSTFDGAVSDPFMMLIPPYEQFLDAYTVATPATGFARNFLNVVAPAGAFVTVDGTAVPASSFTPIAGSGFVGAQVPIAAGAHRLEGSSTFGAFVYGFDSYDSYGYPAGLSLRRFNPRASMFGFRLAAGYVGDPVNTATGNLVDAVTDLDFPASWGMDVVRTYNAMDDSAGSLGRGWSLSSQPSLTQDLDGTVQWHDGDGRVVAFTPTVDGFDRPEEVFAELRVDGDDSYSLHRFDGSVDDYDPAGLLVRSTNWDGQTVTHAHDAAGRVLSSTSSSGASVTYAHVDGQVVSATAGDGRVVTYGYDGSGRLASVTDPAGGITSYRSDTAGRLVRETDPAGRLVTATTYDALGRVASQVQSSGETTSLVYDIITRTTTVTDDASGDVTRYAHDPDGRLLSVTDAAGAVLSKTYDDRGNLTQVVDRRGSTSSTTYDDRGNTTSTTDPAGGVRTRVFDDLDRAIATVDEVGARTTMTFAGRSRIPATITDPAGAVTSVDVVDGLVRSVLDADGVRTSYEYDSGRNLVAAVDGVGARARFGYDAVGRPTSSTLPSGATFTTAYDAVGRVVSNVDALGAASSSEYDPAGLLLSSTDEAGAVTRYRYDEHGNLVETTDAAGQTTTATYDGNGELLSTTAPGGARTTYVYGPLGRLESVTDPVGAVTRFGVDADGRRVQTTDAAGATTSSSHDARGLETARTDATGATWTTAYDARGLQVSTTEPTGAVATAAYDAVGRLVETTDARGGVERRTWTPAGRLASVVDPTGVRTTFGYDGAGRPVSRTAPDGGVTSLQLDLDGRLAASTSPEGVLTSYGYDPVGRVVRILAGDGGATTREYTPRGELARTTDALGGSVAHAYDALGRLLSTTDANGSVTTYAYDGRGNRTSRTDASGATQHWAFDPADRVVSSTDPLGRTAQYTRDVLGRVVEALDASGRRQALTYDAAGRVTARAWAGGQTETFTYDPVGRLVQMTDSTGTTTHAYDAVGDLVETVTGDGRRTATGRDLAGRRTATTYPDGSTAVQAYDGAGRLATVDHPVTGQTSHVWDRDGRLVTEQLRDGQSRSFTYDAAGRVSGFAQDVVGAVRTTALDRDANGRIVRESTAGEDTVYAYDPAGQLLSTTGPALQAGYRYDSLGRRAAATVNGAEIGYSYDAAGQLVQETVDGAVRDYAYDASGRRTGVVDASGTTGHTYDARGLLDTVERTAAATGTTTTEDRTYDATGTLVQVARTEADGVTSTTGVTWDRSGVVPEVLSLHRDGATTDLVYGSRRIAAVTAGAAAVFATDVHGSTISTPGTAGLAVGDRYDAWGNATVATVKDCNGRPVHPLDPNHCAGDAADGTPPDVAGGKGKSRVHSDDPDQAGTGTAPVEGLEFGYRGELHVDALVHLRARDYDPTTGSFTTTDPLDGVDGTPTVANRYHYADNDPLGMVDPLGLRPTDAQLRAGACTVVALDCAFDDFEGMTVLERRQWLSNFESEFGDDYNFTSWFNAIDGILHFADDLDLISDQSWFSIVDAGILEGIQNGLAIVRNRATGLLNPGSQLWARFFDGRLSGADDATSRTLWGRAEQSATNFGLLQTDLRDIDAPLGGETFASVGNIYRGLLTLSDPVQDAASKAAEVSCWIGPLRGPWCDDYADRVEDVVDGAYDLVVDPRNETLTYTGAHALWRAGMLEEWTTPRW